MNPLKSLFLVGVATVSLSSAAHAQTELRLTGSTAFRSATHTAITKIFAPGYRAAHTGSGLSSANQSIFKGTIGGEEVPLSADGTFRVQVPLRDGQQLYPIEAVAADGEQKRNITLEFSRSTPEDNSNPADKAVNEWF